MPEKRRQYEQEFKEGAVRIVRESGKSIAEIARDLDINAGTLGNWVARDRGEREGTQGLSTDRLAVVWAPLPRVQRAPTRSGLMRHFHTRKPVTRSPPGSTTTTPSAGTPPTAC